MRKKKHLSSLLSPIQLPSRLLHLPWGLRRLKKEGNSSFSLLLLLSQISSSPALVFHSLHGISTPTQSTSPPSLTLVFPLLFFTFFHLLLCLPTVLPFCKYIFPETPPSWQLGSAVSYGGTTGADWNQHYQAPYTLILLAASRSLKQKEKGIEVEGFPLAQNLQKLIADAELGHSNRQVTGQTGGFSREMKRVWEGWETHLTGKFLQVLLFHPSGLF